MSTLPRLTRVVLALLLAASLAGRCHAASQVSISLAGKTLQGGKTLLVTATDSLDAAPVYYYGISGFVTTSTNGALAPLLGTGTSSGLLAVLNRVDPALTPYLSGTAIDLSEKLPFTAANVLKSGNDATSSLLTIYASARIKAGVNKGPVVSGTQTGIPYGEITNVSFSLKRPHAGAIVDGTDAFTFLSGKIIVGTYPILATQQPDLSFAVANGRVIGAGVTGTDELASQTYPPQPSAALRRGGTASIAVALQNLGPASDTFTLTAPALSSTTGFTQRFLYRGKDVTATITSGTGSLTIPYLVSASSPTPLVSGSMVTLTWQLRNRSATAGATVSPVLTASSVTDPTAQDAIQFTETAQ